jgi:hypothetical protein
MAALAKVHGVFNRNPNARDTEEDDDDFDPLQIRSPRPGKFPYGMPSDDDGGGPPKKPGGGGGDSSPPSESDRRKKDSGRRPGKPHDFARGMRAVPFEEDDGSIPLKMYQEFSRETIVFYKSLNRMPYRWIIRAGEPFQKDKKIYIPILILGEPLRSRSIIVRYLMNLELLRISSDYYQYNTHGFETIWPFILYLFNNWVRHQVMMMNVAGNRPLFGPDEFMAPNPLAEPLLINETNELNIHANDY